MTGDRALIDATYLRGRHVGNEVEVHEYGRGARMATAETAGTYLAVSPSLCHRCDRAYYVLATEVDAETRPRVCRVCSDIIVRVHQERDCAPWLDALRERYAGSETSVDVIGTGGGCTAIEVAYRGYYVLITGAESACVPDADDDLIMVGIYSALDHYGTELLDFSEVGTDPTETLDAVDRLLAAVSA